MSTRPRAGASFIQGNQSPVGQDASQSVLHYLFQEVSKLSLPIPNRFLETNSKSTWIKSKEDAHSFHCSDNPRLSHMSLSCQSKNMQENSFKVLSLINLQCERLLHQREDGQLDQSSLLLSSIGHPSPSSSPNALKAGHTVQSDLPNSEGTLRSSSNERHIVTASVSQLQKGREDYRPEDSGCKPEPLVKTSSEGCSIKTQITESTGTVKPEQSEDNNEAPQTSEVKFDVELDWSSDWSKDCLSTQHISYEFLPEADTIKEPCNSQQQTASVAEPILTLDHNANVCLNTNSLCDKPLSSPLSMESVEPQCKTSKPSRSLQQPDAQVTASTAECGHSSEGLSQQKSMGFDGENGNPFSAESSHKQKEDSVQCTVQGPTVRAKRRKQSRPRRSVNAQDPDFRGVMFRMDTELDDTQEQCRLVITSKYSKELSKGVKRPRLKAKLSKKSLKTSSDEESDAATSGIKGKLCASCGTKKTPMWRDAEDGTPLCNACGIRYKKYRVRCVNCWHIPKKEGNSNSCCVRCGKFVRQASAHRKPIMLK